MDEKQAHKLIGLVQFVRNSLSGSLIVEGIQDQGSLITVTVRVVIPSEDDC